MYNKPVNEFMDKPKGGRGKKAPYQSTHVRVPVPLKNRVENLAEMYRDGTLEDYDNLRAENKRLADEYKNLLTSNSTMTNCHQVQLDDAIKQAKKIIQQRKSARESIAKLLTSLYGVNVAADSLKD